MWVHAADRQPAEVGRKNEQTLLTGAQFLVPTDLTSRRGSEDPGAGCQRSTAECKHSKASQNALIIGSPKAVVLWGSAARSNPASKECLLLIIRTKETTAKLTRKTGISSLSLCLPLCRPLVGFLSLPAFKTRDYWVSDTHSFHTAWSCAQPPEVMLLPVSICFKFVECCEYYCVCVCNSLEWLNECLSEALARFCTWSGWKISSIRGNRRWVSLVVCGSK